MSHYFNGDERIEYTYICSQCHRYYSVKAAKWLEYIAQKENIHIKHACNGGEPVIKSNGKTYKVDGYCNIDGNIDEFCKWIFNKAKHTRYTFIAHYGKGYDFQFIAEWLIDHGVNHTLYTMARRLSNLK